MLETEEQTPLYLQLKTIIKNKIHMGEYSENSKIPSEHELSETYHVSRVTVRNAIKELVDEGYLIRKKGKGSFVKRKNIFDKIDYFHGFTECMKKNNLNPSSVVLKKQIILADQDIAKKLEISIGEEVLYIQRKRMANNKPIFLENNYFVLQKFGFLVNEDLTGSLYEILKRRNILPIQKSNTTLEIYLADNEISELMSIPFGTPFFYLNTVIKDQNNEPIHYGKDFYLAELYRFQL